MFKIYSVPHTGTNFLAEILGRYKPEVSHFDRGVRQSGLIVSPIRDPMLVWISWVSRGKTDFGRFEKNWKVFNKFYLDGATHVVSVDRKLGLKEMFHYLGIEPIKTSWKPVNSRPRKPVDDIDLSSIYSLDVVKAFY